MMASLQFVANRARTSGVRPSVVSWTRRWAGSAASRKSGHRRGGASRSVAVRIALGGHSTDGLMGGSVSEKPITEPT